MNRRTFLSWIGLGLLASVSPMLLSAIIVKSKLNLFSKQIVFYVALNGNDAWSGTIDTPNKKMTDGPFATISRARDAIRVLKRSQGGILKLPIVVFIRGGSYYLSEPILFAPEDSGTSETPIVYQAYPDEKPIISGGRKISNWQQQGQFWSARLPEVQSGKWNFRMLRVGDKWMRCARYPNFDENNPLTGGWLLVQNRLKPSERGMFDLGVANIGEIGDRLEWKINVPIAGEYRVWVRYAHNMKIYGGISMDGRTTISIGTSQPVPLHNLPDTGSFDKYKWTAAATLYLPVGEQTLVWQNQQGGGINLDAFCLTDDPNWNPKTAIQFPGVAPNYRLQQPHTGTHLILLQAEACNQAIAKQAQIAQNTPVYEISKDRLAIDPNYFPKWKDWQGAEVNIFPALDWVNAIVPVTGVDLQSQTIRLKFSEYSSEYIRPGNRFFISNVREALDRPGEWYLDRAKGELVLLPNSPNFPHGLDIIAPTIDKLFSFQGDRATQSFVEYISVRGLTFQDTNYNLTEDYFEPADAAIWLSTARNCQIEGCKFVDLGGYAVKLAQNSHKNQLHANKMTRLGQGGVILAAADISTQAYQNSIAHNEISDCGRIYKHVAGVYVTCGNNNRIAHNYIHRMPRYGIALRSLHSNHYSNQNIIEFNKIIDTCLETADTCAIGTLGRDKQLSGNVIRYNYIRNVVGMGTTEEGKFLSPYYSWAIYLDDYSSGIEVYGNIAIGTCLGGLYIHGGKDNLIENNIFINGAQSQIQLKPHKDDPQFMHKNKVARNIIAYSDKSAKLWHTQDVRAWRKDTLEQCDFNLYWRSDGVDLSKLGDEITMEGSFAQWQAAGFDRHSLVANPQFVAPERGDYRLKSDSPAFGLGFQAIPFDQIGSQKINV
jgi:hypothetical protein